MSFAHVISKKSIFSKPSYKVILVGLIFITFILCWLGIVVFQRFSIQTELGVQNQFQNVALIKKEQLESFIRERFGDSEILSLRRAIWQSLEAKSNRIISSELRKQLDNTLLETKSAYGYRRIVVLDTSLRPRNEDSKGELAPIVRTTLKSIFITGKPQLVDIYLSNDGQAMFGVAHPVFSKGNPNLGIIGAVYLEMTVEESLYPIISKWANQGPTAEAILARRENNDVVYLTPLLKEPDAGALRVRRSLQNTELSAAMVLNSNQQIPLSGEDYHGAHVLGASIPIKFSNWYLIVKADQMEALKPIRLFGLALLSVMSLLLTFLLIGARLIWRIQKLSYADAEKQLSSRYRAATQASMDAYVAFDNAGKIIDVNDAMVKLTGFSRDELLSRSIRDINSALSTDEIAQEINKIRLNRGSRLKSKWRGKNGALLDVDISSVYLPDSGFETFHSYVRDIGPEIQARHRIEHLNNLYLFLSHANAAIFNAHNADQIFQAVSEGALRDGKFILSWVGILDEEAALVNPMFAYGDAAEYVKKITITIDPSLSTSRGPTRRCMVENKAIYTNDFQNDEMTFPWHDIGERFNINSSVAIPINVDGKAIAALTFYSSEKEYFDHEFLGVLEEVARNVSLALKAISAKQQSEMAEIAQAVSEIRFQQIFEASPIPMQIFSRAARKITAINRAYQNAFGYQLSDIEDEETWFEKAYPDLQLKEQMKYLWEFDLQRIEGIEPRDAVISREIALRCNNGDERIVRGYMSAAGDNIIVQWQDLTEKIHNEAKISKYVKRLEETMEGTLRAVAKMVDIRDPYTAGHEMCVGVIAADIAREMGWSEEQCNNLRLIGLVHDIGKIGVPAELLSKPTRLTPLEYEMIQEHAEKGYEILKDVEFPLPIAEIIREHHERMDGSGYPHGLKGQQILPEARILAVADVLESMASHRPYRPALGIDVAIREIEGHRGTWFDTSVVDALLRLVRERDYQLPDCRNHH